MSDFLSFSLSNDFIEPYKTKDVPWGFNIGGGNSLSELTFVLKYSRKKEDGTKEQWWEVCRRCVEGYYSILKDHAKARKTHWNDQKAQRSAEDAFDRMFNFKWTPPGRGMQHMGTEYIAKSGNGARLINCLAGETEVLTRRGIFPIEELSGETHTLLTSEGWIDAPISSFGEQELYEITLSRAGTEKKIRATANHRWFARDKQKSNDTSFEETLTKDLVPGTSQLKGIHGDVVKLTYSHPVDENRWCVESVIPTGTIENVYCATVEGVGNFALSDNILTGNCAAVTTEKLSTGSTYAATRPFVLLMEMSANGVGVGFDVRGAGNITLHQPDTENPVEHVIEDTREAWAESLGVLLESFFFKNRRAIKFNYSKIRPEGTPLKSFGGVASGPRSLMKMHDKITDLLSNRDGEPLSSRDIVDIMNLAGKCIVSGGSRRCLPADTQVKTTDGSKAIQDILVGDIISTPEGEYPVTNVFAQGEQELVKITHAFGEFECTPNHRMAVWDSVESWSFKEASELTEEDRLVWDYSPWAGSPQKLPELNLHRQFDGSYIRNSGKRGVGKYPDIGCSIDNCDRSASVKSPSNWDGPLCNTHYMRLGKFGDPLTFRGWGRGVNLPEYVTEDFAWLVGVIHGDGNVTISNESKAVLRIPFDDKYPELMLKAERILSEIVPDTNMKWRQGDGNYQILSISNARFANWLGKNVKLPKEPIRIPDWIKNAESNIRAAYLAGVFDTDGSQSPRTFRSTSTVYEEFAKDLQELWMVQGVAATIRVVDRSAYGWQTLYNVDIAGGEFKEAAYRSMLAYSSSKLADFELPKRSGPRMLSYSSAQAVASGIPEQRARANRYGAIGVMAVTELMDVTPKAYPVPIRSVALSRTAQTYDIEVADIHQFTANGFVTHNSALLSLGYKDDKEFINLKNWEIEENSERMGSDGWGHLSNNSIIVNVGDDLGEITEQIAVNGEPGILWSDLSQDYGRLTDLKDCKDQRGILVNPCQPAWASVLTPVGLSTIGKISVGDKIWSEDGWVTVKNKWSTGEKQVNAYRTTAGTFYGTENHRVLQNGEKVEVGVAERIDLLAGDDKLENCGQINSQDVLDGLVIGDGTVHKASNNLITLIIGENDKDYFNDPVEELIGRFRQSISRGSYEVSTTVVSEEMPPLPSRNIPERFFYGDALKVRGFLRGLFSANGSVVANGRRVTLKSSSFTLIEQAQQMLSSLGLKSYYTTNKSKEVEFSNGTYVCKESYDLNISTDREKFVRLIGFIQEYKNRKITITPPRKSKESYEIIAVDELEVEEVFDITVDGPSHTYWTGGLNVSNCAEISLENAELCCLSEIYPTNHGDTEDLKHTIKHAYMYTKAVSMLQTPWPETNEVIMRNHRIGVSMTGIAQFVETRGWQEMANWFNEGYRYISAVDKKYSEWLGVRESIRLTTVKPAGCRPAESLTTTSKGILTLAEIMENHPENDDWADVENLSVSRGDGDHAISRSYDNGKSEVLRVNLSYGMEIESTPEHLWFVKECRAYRSNGSSRGSHRVKVNSWKRTDELTAGDVIESQIGCYNNPTHSKFNKVNMRAIQMISSAKDIRQPKEMNEDLAWLFGYLWGDGAQSPRCWRIRFSDANRPHLERAAKIIEENFGVTGEVTQPTRGDRSDYQLTVASKQLWHWLIGQGIWKYFDEGDGSIDLIPRIVRESSKDDIIAFAAGLVDSDGGAYIMNGNQRAVMITNSNSRFTSHLQHVMWSVGLVIGRSFNKATNGHWGNGCYLMSISGGHSDNDSLDTLAKFSYKVSGMISSNPGSRWSVKNVKSPGKVVGVESLGEMMTYDIEVPNDNWYLNGAIKSHNSTSLVTGVTPGVHWPTTSGYHIRRIRFNHLDPLLDILREAGYHTEPDVMDPNSTVVVSFPTEGIPIRSEREVSIWEKASLAALAQRYWSDNLVSCTLSFRPDEKDQLKPLLSSFQGQLKSASFLPIDDSGTTYAQAPYEPISEDDAKTWMDKIVPIDASRLYGTGAAEFVEDKFCTTDSCEISF